MVDSQQGDNSTGVPLAVGIAFAFAAIVAILNLRGIQLAVVLSVGAVSGMSLVGLTILTVQPAVVERVLLTATVASAGVLGGDALIHQIPEMLAAGRPLSLVLIGVLAGFLGLLAVHRAVAALYGRRASIAPVALVADSMHNAVDGLVIGLAFVAGPKVGIATTVAIVLHEIPHEFANFAILLAAGWSRGRALMWNVLASLTAFLGAAIGLQLGGRFSRLDTIITPAIVGTFLYLAICVLAPGAARLGRVRSAAWIIGGMGLMAVLRLAS